MKLSFYVFLAFYWYLAVIKFTVHYLSPVTSFCILCTANIDFIVLLLEKSEQFEWKNMIFFKNGKKSATNSPGELLVFSFLTAVDGPSSPLKLVSIYFPSIYFKDIPGSRPAPNSCFRFPEWWLKLILKSYHMYANSKQVPSSSFDHMKSWSYFHHGMFCSSAWLTFFLYIFPCFSVLCCCGKNHEWQIELTRDNF